MSPTPSTSPSAVTDPSLQDQWTRCAKLFEKQHGQKPTVAVAAPGRVNLIGEHTDYNDGFVLPMAIQRACVIVAAPNGTKDQVRLTSTLQEETAQFPLSDKLQPGSPKWANYLKGSIVGCLDAGVTGLTGFDALVDSTVPLGGGLSSSAALEVATATLVEALTGQKLDPVQKALIAQKAEHVFAGVPCGIMDQFISVLGQKGHALLLDCRTHQTRAVPMADPKVTVLIANTHVKHELVGGEYAQRRQQCEAAAQTLGVKALRDVTMKQLEAAKEKMDELAYRRARHVVGEIARTLQAADEMTGGFWAVVGQLMYQSHDSLRDDFEVSCAELDLMVDLARELDHNGGVYGSRMTGGGFGGCTVSLVKTEQAAAVANYLAEKYQAKTGIAPTIFSTQPAAGAQVLSLK